jgi:ATP-dependent DNA helicase RecQ
MVSIAEAATCRRRILLRCFGEDGPENCGACDVCLAPPRLFDGTVAAQKLLSPVLRTRLPSGGHFGLGHVLDVLCGRLTPKVAQFGHDRSPTFGIGKDLPDPRGAAWRGSSWRAARWTWRWRTTASWCPRKRRGRSSRARRR